MKFKTDSLPKSSQSNTTLVVKPEQTAEVLYQIFLMDKLQNKFNNKMTYANLTLPLGNADAWSEERLNNVIKNMKEVNAVLDNLRELMSQLDDPIQKLIESYNS